jgi:hypothetical protein
LDGVFFPRVGSSRTEAPSNIDHDDPKYPEGVIGEDEADALVDRTYEIEQKFRAERAQSFYRYASGQVTPRPSSGHSPPASLTGKQPAR